LRTYRSLRFCRRDGEASMASRECDDVERRARRAGA